MVDPNTGQNYFRAIFHDSKLNIGTDWSNNQKTELIDWFKNNPGVDFIKFEVRSDNAKLVNTILKQGDDVRIYRTDVFKSNSNGNGGFLQTLQALTELIVYP